MFIDMCIKLRLDRVMGEQRVSLTDLAQRVGITLANLSILKTNKARAVRFSTLGALCRELKCQPGDLLEYVEGNEQMRVILPIQPPEPGNWGLPGDYY